MRITNNNVVEECLSRIDMLQTMIKHVEEARDFVNSFSYYDNKVDCGNLRSRLIDKEIDEWRNLAMWGLTLEPDEQDRIKGAVYQRFLSENTSISHWLNNGITPSSWFAEDEEKFREMALNAFKPRPIKGS